MSLNLCAGIVTYNPDIERLILNIKAVIPQVSKVVIVDNGSDNLIELQSLVFEFGSDSNKINIILNNKNQGIASALNQITNFAIDLGYDWILTLDQDSIVEENLIRKYQNVLLHVKNTNEIGIISPQYFNKINESDLKILDQDSYFTKEHFVITSGALTSVKALKEVKGFEDRLFIDTVDWDLCIKLRREGYRILVASNTFIDHQLGKIILRSILFKEVLFSSHSPIRYYYFNRNVIILTKKYFKSSREDCLWMLKRLVNKNLGIILFEEQKVKKLKAGIKGLFVGLTD